MNTTDTKSTEIFIPSQDRFYAYIPKNYAFLEVKNTKIADKICVYPVAQQIVGLGTIGLFLTLTISDLARTLFANMKEIYYTYKMGNESIKMFEFSRKNLDLKSVEVIKIKEVMESIMKKIDDIESYKQTIIQDKKNHCSGMKLGLDRMTPGKGTIISHERLKASQKMS